MYKEINLKLNPIELKFLQEAITQLLNRRKGSGFINLTLPLGIKRDIRTQNYMFDPIIEGWKA